MYSTSKLTTYTKPKAMQSKKIAQAVKDYLVDLAINDKLPMDMTTLSIDNLVEVIKTALPTEREKMISLAMHYLCDGDLSTGEMCDAIANHEDPYDIIDNVDGVVVWEKVEMRFTCDDFLQEIGYVTKDENDIN